MLEPWSLCEIEGADGVPLVVAEGGQPDGPEILFLHGFGRSYIDFQSQFEGPLADKYRLIAYDLRGHGNSGKPWRKEDYLESKLWADDVKSVMDATATKKPILVGWSYGGIVALDYVKIYGDSSIAGINFIGNAPVLAYGKMKTSGLSPEDMNGLSVVRNISGYKKALNLLVAEDRGEEWKQHAMLITMMMPAYVRRAMVERSLDYRDVISTIKVPLLITYGEEENGFDNDLADAIEKIMPGARMSTYAGVGHSPFLEAAERFDAELASFTELAIQSQKKDSR